MNSIFNAMLIIYTIILLNTVMSPKSAIGNIQLFTAMSNWVYSMNNGAVLIWILLKWLVMNKAVLYTFSNCLESNYDEFTYAI
jgi:hypothetical protein